MILFVWPASELRPINGAPYMQAVGMVNDHLVDCHRYREILKEVANGPPAGRDLLEEGERHQ